MLQQTQVKTVVPYFNKFIEKYPNLEALLEASEDEILAQWSGLGFYRRAKNIYKSEEGFLCSQRQLAKKEGEAYDKFFHIFINFTLYPY